MLLWSISIAIMVLIFLLSAQSRADSADLSLNVRGLFAQVLSLLGLGRYAQSEGLHHFVRKCAHAFLYFSLGTSVAASAKCSAWKKSPLWALLICFLYATSDEVHQAFVPGRGPQVSDVLLDTVSALVGIGILEFLHCKQLFNRAKGRGKCRNSKHF